MKEEKQRRGGQTARPDASIALFLTDTFGLATFRGHDGKNVLTIEHQDYVVNPAIDKYDFVQNADTDQRMAPTTSNNLRRRFEVVRRLRPQSALGACTEAHWKHDRDHLLLPKNQGVLRSLQNRTPQKKEAHPMTHLFH